MSILDRIKAESKRTGGSKGKFLYIGEGNKKRIRFLDDLEDGIEVDIHKSYEKGLNCPCQEAFGRPCPYDDAEDIPDLRTRTEFMWNVYDYDSDSVLIYKMAANNFSPLPQLASMYEEYGTLTDRDYVIKQQGKALDMSFTVIPQDKKKFRVKAKPYSREAILKMLDKAWPCPDSVEDDDEDEEDDNPLLTDEDKYKGKKPQELYKMCIDRDLDVEKKKPAAYYINVLVEDDQAEADWGDDGEDDDWDDEE